MDFSCRTITKLGKARARIEWFSPISIRPPSPIAGDAERRQAAEPPIAQASCERAANGLQTGCKRAANGLQSYASTTGVPLYGDGGISHVANEMQDLPPEVFFAGIEMRDDRRMVVPAQLNQAWRDAAMA